MNEAKRKLCERLLSTHSVSDVAALINRTISGEPVAYHEVETIRRAMVKDRKIEARPPKIEVAPPSLKPDAEPYSDPRARQKVSADELGSKRLHEATVAMFARRAVQMGCDMPTAGARVLHPGAA